MATRSQAGKTQRSIEEVVDLQKQSNVLLRSMDKKLDKLEGMDKKLDKLEGIEDRLDTMSAQLEDVNTKLGRVVLQADTLNNMEGLLGEMVKILRNTPAGKNMGE